MEPSYRILSTGDLEIAAIGGWRLVSGCSCKGIFEYGDRMAELAERMQEAEPTDTVESLYQDDRRVQYLCDRVLELNGLAPEHIRPRDLGWLLFGYVDESGQPQQSPLALLNTPPPPRHPRKPSPGSGPSDFVSMLAAIASQPDTSMEEAIRIATSEPARLVLATLEERAWGAMSPEDKDDAKFKAWAGGEQRAAGLDLGGWGIE